MKLILQKLDGLGYSAVKVASSQLSLRIKHF